MIYQAVGYKRQSYRRPDFPHDRLVAKKRGERTTRFNVACAEADHLAERHPDLIWNVETVGASQQVRR